MGYHHDHREFQESPGFLFGESGEHNATSRQLPPRHLQPLEALRLLQEGAALVQIRPKTADRPPTAGAVLLEAPLDRRRVRKLLPDRSLPLICVGTVPDGSARDLAQELIAFGYGYVFLFPPTGAGVSR